LNEAVERSIDYKVRLYIKHSEDASEEEILKQLDEALNKAVGDIEGINDFFVRRFSTHAYE
jgi:hypothetical protein